MFSCLSITLTKNIPNLTIIKQIAPAKNVWRALSGTKKLIPANVKREIISAAVPIDTIFAASSCLLENGILKIFDIEWNESYELKKVTIENPSDFKYIGSTLEKILSENSPDETPMIIFT